MNDAEIRRLACDLLAGIAPDTDPASLAGGADIREALDIDSIDFLNFVIALGKATGRTIPEADYARLFTMDGIAAYLRD
ncbi:MAG TPA: acyl carrier protein [Rhizobiales bacterium]|nr:acyl carrier protein [Hyphomicrobiales bacterium]